MSDVTYWEDLKEGDEIPSLEANLNASQLFQMSAVTQNVHRIHFDEAWAKHEGYEERVIHGPFHGEVLVQTVQKWIGNTGWMTKINYSNRRYAVLGDTLTGRGKITKLYKRDDRHLADLEVWVEKGDGPEDITAPGTATVQLPTREIPISVPS